VTKFSSKTTTTGGRVMREGGVMIFKDNFINLTPREMVDPVLKVSIIDGRTEMDGPNPEQGIVVHYDPEIQDDRLMVSLTKEEIEYRNKWNLTRPNDDLIPFHSYKRREIFRCVFEEITEGRRLTLRCQNSENLYRSQQVYFDRQLGGRAGEVLIKKHLYEFVDYIMRSMLKWYNYREVNVSQDEKSNSEPPRQLILVLDKGFAKHLPSAKSRSFELYSDTQIVFDTRDVGQ
jgi:hypothetical protein